MRKTGLGWYFCIAALVVGCNETSDSNEHKSGDGTREKESDTDTEASNELLIDDCDDGDEETLLGGIWVTYDDRNDQDNGESEVWPKSWFKDGTFEMSQKGYGDTGYAARMTGTTGDKLGWDYVGMAVSLGADGFCPEATPTEIDLQSYTGIRFMAKGTAEGGALSAKIIHTKDGKDDNCKINGLTGDTLTDWVDFSADFTEQLTEEWSEISLRFKKDFKGANAVDIETVLEHAKDIHFFFQSTHGGEVAVSIDNLALYRSDEPVDEEDTDIGVDIDRSGEPEFLLSQEDNESAVLFDRTSVTEIRLTLPPKEWDALQENAVDELYTPADVTIMDETFHEVGLRFKGSYGSLFGCFEDGKNHCDKLPMKIKFSEYVEEQRFLGLKRINLHSLRHDGSKMRDCLAYDVYREMGIAAPRCSYADVYVNDEHLGLFGVMEQIDGRFTKNRFSKGNGNLYKEAWPLNNNEWYFDQRLKTNSDESPDHEAFMAFTSEMMRVEDDDVRSERLGLWMDIDYVLRYMAVDYAIANWDGITTFYCGLTWDCGNHNFYMYQEQERPFFWLIPWDLEASFSVYHWLGEVAEWDDFDAKCEDIPMMPGETSMYVRPAGCDPTIRAIAVADKPLYRDYLKEIVENYLEEETVLSKINSLSQLIEPYVELDPDVEVDAWQADVEGLINDMVLIRSRIETAL